MLIDADGSHADLPRECAQVDRRGPQIHERLCEGELRAADEHEHNQNQEAVRRHTGL